MLVFNHYTVYMCHPIFSFFLVSGLVLPKKKKKKEIFCVVNDRKDELCRLDPL